MSFNKFMHPRNIYRKAPDFKSLADSYPEFKPYVTCDSSGKGHVDYKNHDALRALTKTLLKHDFNLEVEILPQRLIPTLPSRLNYILWIEDLLETIPESLKTSGKVRGLDIGTGCTCIYPMIGTKKNNWNFVATDCDDEAINCAKRNIECNKLQDAIKILMGSSESYLSHIVEDTGDQFDFCMCNPPFFVNDEDANPYGKGRPSRPPPKAINCPTETEAITEGGEVALIEKMLQESLFLKDKIKIYTSMMGKKQSLKYIKKGLWKHLGKEISSFVSTEFCQGHTIRWGIAWTLIPDINLDKVAVHKRSKETVSKLMGFEIKHSLKNPDASLENTLEVITDVLEELKIKYTELKVNRQMASLHCKALENTWSNQRRKRRALAQPDKTVSTIIPDCIPKESSGLSECINEQIKEHFQNSTTRNGKRDGDSVAKEDSQLESLILVQYLLTLRKVDKHFVLEMQWISGSLGKDGCHQIMQYLKNKLG